MDCRILTSKTVLLLLSCIFWAAGAALSYVGAYVINSYKHFDNFLTDKYILIPAAIIIVIAVVLFIIGLIGCCATLRESTVGLSCFLLIIVLLFAAEVTAFVFGFAYRGRGNLEKSMSDVFQKYDGQNSETRAVNYLQSQLKCCGVQNYTDWTSTPWYKSHNSSVPQSCCKENHTCTGKIDQPELLNAQGCEAKLEQLLQDVLSYAMLVILGFAIIKLFGMLSICVITCRSSKGSYQPVYSA
ncbi:tetraspanin 36 [Electrophorus electricus]|nr:tetraspanin 36 [Electrophorus electricus]